MNKLEQKLLTDIASGKYRDFYLVYDRKSTDEPESQKNSLKYQKAENVRFAFREKLQIAPITIKGFCFDGIISEKHSGFKEDSEITFSEDGQVQYRIDRPKFFQLVNFSSKKYFKGIVVLCWDRISRNKGDDTIVRKLMKQGIDVRFTYANYDKTSAGELHMDIDGMFAEHHARVTSEKVSINTRNQRDKGVCTYKAPVGYLNQGIMENKPLDPIRAPIIKQMFELCATGEWSLNDIAKWANEQGFTMPPMKRRRTEDEMLAEETDEDVEIEAICRPVTYTGVHKILTSRFYTGRILGNDGKCNVLSTSHEALVSDELFEEVQIALRKKKISVHYVERLDHPYRGLVRCEDCERAYTPYPKKGIMYYGSRCRANCPNDNKNFNANFLESKIGEFMSNLSFTEDELIEMDARTKTDIAVFEHKRISVIEQNDRRKKKIREDISYLRNNKLNLLRSGAYSPEEYMKEEETLNSELTVLQDAEQVSDIAMHEVIKEIVKLSELLKIAYLYYDKATSNEKEQIIKIIFSELSLSGNTLKYKCKNGFQVLESRFFSKCDPTENRTLIIGLKTRCPNR